MLIAFSGKRGAGKDTACDIVRPILRAHKIGFADPMKNMLIREFGVSPVIAFGDNALKESLVPGSALTVRQALQHLGQAMKVIDPKYWLRQWAYSTEFYANVVVNDLRFPDELDLVHRMGGRVIRLTRYACLDSHPSETAMDGCSDFDVIIDNRDMSLEEFSTAVRAACSL